MKLNTKKRSKVNPKQVLRERYADKLQNELEVKGVDFFQPDEQGGSLHIDKDYLVLPQNITDVPARDLGEYLNAFTQQKAYLRTLLGYAELFCEESRRDYVEASGEKFRSLLGSKLSETAKEREVNFDPDVKPYFDAYMDNKNKVRLLNLNIASVEDIIFLISREVSRRTGDFNEERRSYNVSKK